MNLPLLQTKLYIPQLRRQDMVARPHLRQRLQWRAGQKLTLISAPAGFGKTTLVSEWIAELGLDFSTVPPIENPKSPPSTVQVAWLSLDENDNEIARFLAYWVAAIRRVDDALGREAEAMLQASEPPTAIPLLTTLLNDLAMHPHALLLVLDDYHVIQETALHEAITFWLDYAPAQCHLVITTRTEPPLPLALWRSRGQVNEIRADDLRFSETEITYFFRQAMAIDLSAANVQALAARTEGWIAGLKMAGLSMRGHENISAFIERFSGSHRFIIDYLADQVLDHCSDALRKFLLHTSVLERMCAPLVDALLLDLAATSGRDSQSLLEELEAANLFIVPLDDERRWYRYHHLFGELLQHRLRRVDPALEATLHARAGAWYEEAGHLAEAIDHLLAAQQFTSAAQLIERVAHEMAYRLELYTLGRWVEALPDDLWPRYPGIVQPYGIVLSVAGRFEEYDRHLETVERIALARPDQMESRTMLGQVLVLKCIQAFFLGDFVEALDRVRHTHEVLAQYGFPTERWELASIRGYAGLQWHGDIQRIQENLIESTRIATTDMGHVGMTLCYSFLTNAYITLGELHRAVTAANRALEASTNADGSHLPSAAYPQALLGRIYYEWNRLDDADRLLQSAVDPLTHVTGFTTDPLDTTLTIVLLRQVQGDSDGATAQLAAAQAFFQRAPISADFRTRLDAIGARLALLQGRLTDAAQWADSLPIPSDEAHFHPIQCFSYFTWARVQLARHEYTTVLPLLKRLQSWAQRKALTSFMIESALLLALANAAANNEEAALTHLQETLTLAEPQGYIRLFVDEGEAMQQLLRQAATRGIAVDYALKLLTAFDTSTGEEAVATLPAGNALLIEPLSARELEVLQLIEAGHTNQQIADELIIAVSTVKRHINNIYGKLHAQSRTHALARARELNLL